MQNFIRPYSIAMLWSSVGEDQEPLDNTYSLADISSDARCRIEEDCKAFVTLASQRGIDLLSTTELAEQSGHDFWFTRNHHGSGFWDRPEVYGKKEALILTEIACSRQFGELDAYVTDTNNIDLE